MHYFFIYTRVPKTLNFFLIFKLINFFKVREKFGDLTVNVFVLAMGDYLKTFHSIHQNIFDVFESLDAAIHDNSQTQG